MADPCAPVRSPEALADRAAIRRENELVDWLLTTPRGKAISQEGGETLTRERAREIIGSAGGYNAVGYFGRQRLASEIPTEAQLNEAERRLKLEAKLLNKPRTRWRRVAEAVLQPFVHFGRFTFLDQVRDLELAAIGIKRNVRRTGTETTREIRIVMNEVLGTERSPTARPWSFLDRIRGRGTGATEAMKEVWIEQARASREVRDLETKFDGPDLAEPLRELLRQHRAGKSVSAGLAKLNLDEAFWSEYLAAQGRNRDAMAKLWKLAEENPFVKLSAELYQMRTGVDLRGDDRNPVELRNRIEADWVKRFGADKASKLMALDAKIKKMHQALLQELLRSTGVAQRATELKLRRMRGDLGISDVEAKIAARILHEIDTKALPKDFAHRIILHHLVGKMERQAKSELSEIAQQRKDPLDLALKAFDNRRARLKKQGRDHELTFLEFITDWAPRHKKSFLPNTGIERLPDYMSDDPSMLAFPDIVTATESYVAQVQDFAYRSRINHADELALDIIRGLRAGVRDGSVSQKRYEENLDALHRFIIRRHHDITMKDMSRKSDQRRNLTHAVLAWQTFSKIGYNPKTITQNSSQLFMQWMAMGHGALLEGQRFLSTPEGKRLREQEGLDFDASTHESQIHTQDALFREHFNKMRPERWDEKLLRAMDFMISKTGALKMLSWSEMRLHELAFASTYVPAYRAMGKNMQLRAFFQNMPEYLRSRATDKGFRRPEFLMEYGVTEKDLNPENWDSVILEGDMHPSETRLWEQRLDSYIKKRAVRVAHDARIFMNGDYSTAARPEIFRTNWGKLLFQFRLFDLIYLNYMGQGFKKFFRRTRMGMSPIEGEERQKIFGLNMPAEQAWMLRLAALIPFINMISGLIRSDIAGWMEPSSLQMLQGIGDWFSDDERRKRYAFFGKGPVTRLVGPAASDVIDAVHWSAFDTLDPRDPFSQFFFGTQRWADKSEKKRRKEVWRKINIAWANALFTAAPLIEKGHFGQALWEWSVPPAYEKRKQFVKTKEQSGRTARDLTDMDEVQKLLAEIAKLGAPGR